VDRVKITLSAAGILPSPAAKLLYGD